MVTLPLKSVHHDDYDLVDRDIICLSQLARNNFPVASGLVVFPPYLEFNSILDRHGRIFEDNAKELKQQLRTISMPEELIKEFKKARINLAQAWEMVLEKWWQQIERSHSLNRKLNLKAQYILLTDSIKSCGFGYIDSASKKVAINITSGNITQSQRQELEDLIIRAQKNLVIKMRFDWIIDSGIKIIKVSSRQDFVLKADFGNVITIKPDSSAFRVLPKTKLILNLSENYVVDPNADSVIIYSDESTEVEDKLFKIIESAKTYPNGEIIYRLADKSSDSQVLRGVSLLNSNPKLLNQEIMILNLARNAYLNYNVHLGIPYVRNFAELKHFTEALAKFGIKRSVSFKYYLEVSEVENILNLEEFLEDIDCVIFDLDCLKLETKSVVKLLKDPIEKLNQGKVPFMVKCRYFDETLVRILVDLGVWGLIVKEANMSPMQDVLSKVEVSSISEVKH